MKFYAGIPAIIGSMAMTSAIVITLPLSAKALTGPQVNDIARDVTVLIIGQKGEATGHGSGVIIAKDGSTYYALTNVHVIGGWEKSILVAPDKKAYEIDLTKVKPLPGVDLAVVAFTSDQDYKVAKLANSELASEGQDVFVSGWPAPGNTGQLIRQFTDGRISGFLNQPVEGYQMIYTNVTRRGMSGGPVFDAGGRVIGIHGQGDYEDPSQLVGNEGMSPEAAARIASLIKPGFNYAIPINTYLQLAPQAGIYLGVQVENSAAPDIGATNVASIQPDERDKIDDINDVFDTVSEGLNTVERGTNLLRRGRRLLGF